MNCLAKGVPIVTPDYFRDLSSAALSRQPLPEVAINESVSKIGNTVLVTVYSNRAIWSVNSHLLVR